MVLYQLHAPHALLPPHSKLPVFWAQPAEKRTLKTPQQPRRQSQGWPQQEGQGICSQWLIVHTQGGEGVSARQHWGNMKEQPSTAVQNLVSLWWPQVVRKRILSTGISPLCPRGAWLSTQAAPRSHSHSLDLSPQQPLLSSPSACSQCSGQVV